MSHQLTESNVCDRCDQEKTPLSWCVNCRTRVCNACWELVPGHRIDRLGPQDLPHEKTDYRSFVRLQNILYPNLSEDELRHLHEADGEAFWFGTSNDRYGEPYFTDGGIYSSLMAQSGHSERTPKYPQLVSFIGQTNAGKSALIKMLIDQEERILSSNEEPSFPSPVVGSALYENEPTSANVHLYADPRTLLDASGHTPLLFADCEGLDAGARVPRAEIARRQPEQIEILYDWIRHGRKRKLAWAKNEQMRGRQFTVKQLYPRILYTFSDVVVFVLKNSKTFEKTALNNLLNWGEYSLEQSINQPALPHAIIVLNGSRIERSNSKLGTRETTRNLLESVSTSFDQDPDIMPLIRSWRERGKRIRDCRDLIGCYYASFSVVKIPMEEQGQYNLLAKQISTLRQEIDKCCRLSYEAKREARLLSKADELDVYVQHAFDHFSTYLDRPFDFVKISLQHKPIPENFGEHLLQLAQEIQDQGNKRNRQRLTGQSIFKKMGIVVSSSVLLECMRYHKGRASQHLDEYTDYIDNVLWEFCVKSYPCEYDSDGRRCINTRQRHGKGHQDAAGRVRVGDYKSRFTYETSIRPWIDRVHRQLQHLEGRMQGLRNVQGNQGRTDASLALQLHSEAMTALYDEIDSEKLFSGRSTCFSCLMAIPQHALPCRHLLCNACVRGHGHLRQNIGYDHEHVYELQQCPLHANDRTWKRPFIVRFKPNLVGVRVLSLDGGGIRGIVELETLFQIEKEMKNNELKIPLRAFFDLVVGTSTGSIIALCLATKSWGLEKCIDTFRSLCDQAFTPRRLQGIPLLQFATNFRHGGSKYKTRPLHKALREVLGTKKLFGGKPHETAYRPKVAVTTTEGEGTKAIVIGNYNRPEISSILSLANTSKREVDYEFLRPSDPKCEFNTWEAAAASTAAPRFFKKFRHQTSQRSFLDGALYHNNPARVVQGERKALWPDVADHDPDIFLSLGTGQNESRIQHQLRNEDEAEDSTKTEKVYGSSAVRDMLRVLVNRIGSIVDAERAWNDFLAQERQQPNHNSSRYIRINPDFGEDPPKIDAKKEIDQLHRQAKRILATSRYKDTIKDVVLRLAASSFYFVKSSSKMVEHGQTHRIKGNICCRFEDGSRNLRRMGEFLRNQQKPASKPTFHIINNENNTVIQRIELRSTVIANMLDRAVFAPEACEIDVPVPSAWVAINISLVNTNDIPDHYPISGFPRLLPDMPPRDRRPRASRNATTNEQNQSLPEVPELETTQSTRRIRTEGTASTSTPAYRDRVPAVELDADSRMPSRAAQSTSSGRNVDESGNHKQRREWRPKDPARRPEPDPAPVELPGDARPRPRRHHSSLPRERDQLIELPSHVPLSSIHPLSSVSSTISERTESSSSPFAPQSTRAVPAASPSGTSSRTVVRETGGRVERRRSYISLSSPLQRLERRHRQPPPPPSWHGEYSDDDVESSVL